MSNARKLFRMFKSLIEWQKINVLLGKASSTPPLKFILQMIPRVAFFFYWILDTIVVLSKIKFLTTVDNVKLMYRWAFLWTIANVTSLLGALLELADLAQEEKKLKKKMTGSNNVQDEDKGQQNSQNIAKQVQMINAKRFSQILIVIKSCGDLITSTQSMGLPKQLFGFEFSDGAIGIGGGTSAAISCY